MINHVYSIKYHALPIYNTAIQYQGSICCLVIKNCCVLVFVNRHEQQSSITVLIKIYNTKVYLQWPLTALYTRIYDLILSLHIKVYFPVNMFHASKKLKIDYSSVKNSCCQLRSSRYYYYILYQHHTSIGIKSCLETKRKKEK